MELDRVTDKKRSLPRKTVLWSLMLVALIGVLSVLFLTQDAHQEEPQLPLAELSDSTLARYPDFNISQMIQNSTPYYRLSIHDSEDYLLLNEAQTELTLYSGDQSLTLPVATLFGNATAAPATLALQDLTQDGVAELVFLHEDGGTGALGTQVHIVDRTTMTEYTLPDVVAALAPTVSLAPTSIVTSDDATYVWCDLYTDSSAVTEVVIQPFEVLSLESYQYNPDAQTGSWAQIALTEDGLQCTVGLQVAHQVPWEYFCMVTSDIVYDVTMEQFAMGENRNVVPMDTAIVSEASAIDRATPRDAYTTWQADLTNDGQDETIFFDPAAFEEIGVARLYVQEADETALPTEETLWRTAEAECLDISQEISYSIYENERGVYLFRYQQRWKDGIGTYEYHLFSLLYTGAVRTEAHEVCTIYTLNGAEVGEWYTSENNIAQITAFFEAVSAYTAQSTLLVSTVQSANYQDADGNALKIEGDYLVGTAENPIGFVPVFIPEEAVPEGAVIAANATPSELLAAQLTAFNQQNSESNAVLTAENIRLIEESMAEIGMTEPFTATTTYGDKVAESYAEHPEAFIGMSYSLGWNDAYLAIGDADGNEIKVGVVAHDESGTERPDFTDSTGMLNEVYWNGVYQGDLPGASDAIMWDFYAYDYFMLMVDSAHYMPQGTNLQVMVDSTTEGNNKEISSVAYALYSPNGTVVERGEVDNTDAQDGVVTLEIPALDYHGEDVVMIQVTVHLTDDSTQDPENRIVFSMPCRAEE